VTDQQTVLALLTPERRVELTIPSDIAGLKQAGLHFGVLVALSLAIVLKAPFWPLLMLPQGIVLIFLFTAHHEMIHRTAFASRRLNDTLARLCGLLVFVPTTWFRYFHAAHHRHTQDPALDPELASPKPETWPQYFLHISGLPIWKGMAETLFANAFRPVTDAFVPQKARGRVRREARLTLLVYAGLITLSALAGSALLLWLWIIPALLGQPFLRLYLLAEHGRCAFCANMLENSRTTFTNRLVRRLAWNMPYHAEHHSYPSVPFHRLPELHRHMRDYLRVTEDGYVRFHAKYCAEALAPADKSV
jgi:fatty acid desaturase